MLIGPFWPKAHTIKRLIRTFTYDHSAGLSVAFGLALGAIVLAGGAALDIANASNQRFRLQAVADSAAIAGAREFRLGNTNEKVIRDAMVSYAKAGLGDHADQVTIDPAADATARTASVTLSAQPLTYIIHFFRSERSLPVKVTASARMTGGSPICVVGLEVAQNQTVELEKTAKLSAPGCAVYSNSKKSDGLVAKNSASMVANFICSAGGKEAGGAGSFMPTPRTDCPVLPDPLLSRPLPSPGPCVKTNYVVKSVMETLSEGTYCGGLTIEDKAIVTLNPGIYIFKDGPLLVKNGGRLTGVNVNLHFSGGSAIMKLEEQTVVSLTAPKSGSMAGLLITEGRANPLQQQFEIYSNDTRMLLGTIYLPQGRLFVAANKPVSDQSAYTIIVARRFTLSEGPTMVLNSNYGATDIPVPNGVGPTGGATHLIR
jgi:Flp pilus assembly protein TadG